MRLRRRVELREAFGNVTFGKIFEEVLYSSVRNFASLDCECIDGEKCREEGISEKLRRKNRRRRRSGVELSPKID